MILANETNMIQYGEKPAKHVSDSDFAFMTKFVMLTICYPEFEAEVAALTPEGQKAPPLDAARDLVNKWSQRIHLNGLEICAS